MKIDNDLMREARAEMLLNYLYPDKNNEWIAEYKGTFYRNYSEDILSLNDKKKRVELSRDGFLKLLPQGVVTTENDLKKGDFETNYKRQCKEISLLTEMFLPIDSFQFRKSVEVENRISSLLDEKYRFFIDRCTQYIKVDRNNRYIRDMIHLLPFAHKLRGNMGLIEELITVLTGFEVEKSTGYYTECERATCSIPYMQYSVVVKDLDTQEYLKTKNEMQPFFDFLLQWFVPFDIHVEFKIKHHNKPFEIGEKMTLDYNTEISEPIDVEL